MAGLQACHLRAPRAAREALVQAGPAGTDLSRWCPAPPSPEWPRLSAPGRPLPYPAGSVSLASAGLSTALRTTSETLSPGSPTPQLSTLSPGLCHLSVPTNTLGHLLTC